MGVAQAWYMSRALPRVPALRTWCPACSKRVITLLCEVTHAERRVFGGVLTATVTQGRNHESEARARTQCHIHSFGAIQAQGMCQDGRPWRARLVDGRLELRLQQLQARLFIVGQVS